MYGTKLPIYIQFTNSCKAQSLTKICVSICKNRRPRSTHTYIHIYTHTFNCDRLVHLGCFHHAIHLLRCIQNASTVLYTVLVLQRLSSDCDEIAYIEQTCLYYTNNDIIELCWGCCCCCSLNIYYYCHQSVGQLWG